MHLFCRPDAHRSRPFGSLSGGQQALATLALSFALQAAFPSPFYFFDEIDSALDTSNASRVADYISSQKGAQYLVVSHKPQVTLSIPRTDAVYVHAQFEPCWGDRSGGLPEMGHCMQVSTLTVHILCIYY